MIDRDDIKCPVCRSLHIKQAYQQQVNGKDTVRKNREETKQEIDNVQQLYCHPVDPTWYGCVMCNTEFDGEGNEYKIRKMYPFDKSANGEIN